MQNQIPKNWQKMKLGELAELIPGSAFNSGDFSTVGTPVIKIRNIASGTLTLDNLEYFAGDINGLDKYKISKGDILISMTGSHVSQWSSVVGKITRNNKDQVFLMNQRVGKIKPNLAKVDNDFLYYSLHNDATTLNLANRAGGSANQANISPEIIKSLEIIIPELDEQKKIASIISAFDDKIEVNNKIAKTLEEIAQAIFKEWFVNFCFPRYEKTEFVDSEIGKIPKGWEVKALGEICDIVYGKGLSTQELKKSGFPVYGGNGIIGFSEKYLYDEPQIIIGCRGAYSGNIFRTKSKSWVTHNSLILKIDKQNIGTNFLYYCLHKSNVKSTISGSAQPQITTTELNKLFLIKPSKNLLDLFEEVIQPFEEKRIEIEDESQKLAALRDLLLPKLMRGKVKVV